MRGPVRNIELMLKFKIDEEKAIESIVWIASNWPQVTPFYVAKILFLAEKDHLNKFGRPIIADTYIAMPYGPVPSTIRDFIESNALFSDFVGTFEESVQVDRSKKYAEISARREPNLELFSKSDIQCLMAALKFCKTKTFGELSELTHRDRAWLDTAPNSPMDYANFIDDTNPARDTILDQAWENSVFGA